MALDSIIRKALQGSNGVLVVHISSKGVSTTWLLPAWPHKTQGPPSRILELSCEGESVLASQQHQEVLAKLRQTLSKFPRKLGGWRVTQGTVGNLRQLSQLQQCHTVPFACETRLPLEFNHGKRKGSLSRSSWLLLSISKFWLYRRHVMLPPAFASALRDARFYPLNTVLRTVETCLHALARLSQTLNGS